MKTLKSFIEKTNLPASLVRAVVRQLGGWKSFTETAPDINRHGISGGYGGFIYYKDTIPFAKRNRKAILEALKQQQEQWGSGFNLVQMVKSFNCLKDLQVTEDEIIHALAGQAGVYAVGGVAVGYQVPNALAWYAGEEVCRSYGDLLESEKWESRERVAAHHIASGGSEWVQAGKVQKV